MGNTFNTFFFLALLTVIISLEEYICHILFIMYFVVYYLLYILYICLCYIYFMYTYIFLIPSTIDSISWLFTLWGEHINVLILSFISFPSYHNQMRHFNVRCQERKHESCSTTRPKSSFCLACGLIPKAVKWSTVCNITFFYVKIAHIFFT